MIAGLEEISGGTISIGEKRVNDLPRRIATSRWCSELCALSAHERRAEHGFSLKLRRRSRADIRKRVEEAAAILGLTNLLGRYPRQLSAASASASQWACHRRDPQSSCSMSRFQPGCKITRPDARRGQGTASTAEDDDRIRHARPIEAMTMADKIVVMLDAISNRSARRWSFMIAPRRVRGRLYRLSVHEFIRGSVGSRKPNEFIGDDGTRIDMGVPRNVPAGLPVVLGIRPEHIEICNTDAPDAVHGSIVVLEPTGSETILQSVTAGTPMTALVRERVAPGRARRSGFVSPRRTCISSMRRSTMAADWRAEPRLFQPKFD